MDEKEYKDSFYVFTCLIDSVKGSHEVLELFNLSVQFSSDQNQPRLVKDDERTLTYIETLKVERHDRLYHW